MTDRHDTRPVSEPLRFPDGRLKSSPDDTSLLGLAAVWTEIDAPLPPRTPDAGGRPQVRNGAHQRHAKPRVRRARSVVGPVAAGVIVAVALAVGIAVLFGLLL